MFSNLILFDFIRKMIYYPSGDNMKRILILTCLVPAFAVSELTESQQQALNGLIDYARVNNDQACLFSMGIDNYLAADPEEMQVSIYIGAIIGLKSVQATTEHGISLGLLPPSVKQDMLASFIAKHIHEKGSWQMKTAEYIWAHDFPDLTENQQLERCDTAVFSDDDYEDY